VLVDRIHPVHRLWLFHRLDIEVHHRRHLWPACATGLPEASGTETLGYSAGSGTALLPGLAAESLQGAL
jgi:hypothetical protein